LYQEGLVNTEPQAVKGPLDFLMGDCCLLYVN
jgi:hypothetical protein